jgi:CubicO group peptidase (beta-lactamase class C family)
MTFHILAARLAAASWLLLATQAWAAGPACEAPARMDDGWEVAADAGKAGFEPDRLCEAVRAFAASRRNLHSLVVARGGVLVAERYREGQDVSSIPLIPATTRFDAATRHDLRSISKSVVSLLWGIAQAEGKTPSLQTPVLDLLPALADLKKGGRERITIEDLLCMRSGLDWNESGDYRGWSNDESGLSWRGDQARYVFDRPMAAPAATRFNYNGGGTAVLAQLLVQRVGVPLPEYARRKLFEPLGITDWEWLTDMRGRPRAYSGLRMRPRDLAKIGRMVAQGGRWNGQQVVPTAWLQASLVPHLPAGDYGYQWWMGAVQGNGTTHVWRAGVGNGGQRLFIVPELDLVVVMTAGEYDDPSIGPELRRLLTMVVGAVQVRALV